MPLRPMSLADLLDGAFRLLKVNGGLILGLALAIAGPLQLVSVYLQRELISGSGDAWRLIVQPTGTPAGGDAGAVLPEGLQLAVSAAQVLLVVPLLAGAVAVVAGRSALGQAVDRRGVVGRVVRRAPHLIGGALLVHLLEFGVAVVGVVLLGAGAGGLGGFLIAVGLVGAFLTMPLYVAVAPVIAVEGVGPIAAVRRSSRLLRPRYGATLGTAIVSALMGAFLALAVATLPASLSLLLGRHGWVAVGIGSVLANLVSLPFVTLVATLMYVDGRIRHEGLDLQLMTREYLDAR